MKNQVFTTRTLYSKTNEWIEGKKTDTIFFSFFVMVHWCFVSSTF